MSANWVGMKRLFAFGAALLVFMAFAASASATVMVGTTHNDNITGTSGDDVIRGRGGDDTLQGNGGNDAVYGGSGNDHIQSGVAGAPGFVRCGDGEDFATVGVNVKVRKCEHVKRING